MQADQKKGQDDLRKQDALREDKKEQAKQRKRKSTIRKEHTTPNKLHTNEFHKMIAHE